MTYELITIAFSHYCEKARWVLDRNRVPYRERRYLPGFHRFPTRRALRGTDAGAEDAVSSRFSTPILLGDGAPLADSTDIMRRFDPELFEEPEAVELERYFSVELGPHTRRVAYFVLFENPPVLFRMARDNVAWPQALAFRVMFPAVQARMREMLSIHREGYEDSLARARRVVAEVDERLADGRRFLVGDRFSAADLAFAAMLAPAVMPKPDVYGARLPQPETLPEERAALVREMRDTSAGRFALRIFAEERWPRA